MAAAGLERPGTRKRSYIGPPGWTLTAEDGTHTYHHAVTGKTLLVPPQLEPWQQRLHELLSSEASYRADVERLVAVADVLRDGVLEPLPDASQASPPRRISGASELLHLSRRILEDYETKTEALRGEGIEKAYAEAGAAAHAFKLAGAHMKVLVDYANGYGDEFRACTALIEQKPWLLPRLKESLSPADGAEPAPTPSEALASLLIRPIQRLTRYGSLFEALVQDLDASHPYHDALTDAADEVCRAARSVDSTLAAVSCSSVGSISLASLQLSGGCPSVAEASAASTSASGGQLPGSKFAVAEEVRRGSGEEYSFMRHALTNPACTLRLALDVEAYTGRTDPKATMSSRDDVIKNARVYVFSDHLLVAKPRDLLSLSHLSWVAQQAGNAMARLRGSSDAAAPAGREALSQISGQVLEAARRHDSFSLRNWLPLSSVEVSEPARHVSGVSGDVDVTRTLEIRVKDAMLGKRRQRCTCLDAASAARLRAAIEQGHAECRQLQRRSMAAASSDANSVAAAAPALEEAALQTEQQRLDEAVTSGESLSREITSETTYFPRDDSSGRDALNAVASAPEVAAAAAASVEAAGPADASASSHPFCRPVLDTGGTAAAATSPDAEDSEAAVQCAACKELIGRDRKKVIALSRRYHRECFKCTTCSRPLYVGFTIAEDGEPYCRQHARGRHGVTIVAEHCALVSSGSGRTQFAMLGCPQDTE